MTRLITEGWRDPQNRRSLSRTEVVQPGRRYQLDVTMQANDYVFAPGHRIAFVVMQSEEDYTILPPAGNKMSCGHELHDAEPAGGRRSGGAGRRHPLTQGPGG